MNYGHLKTFDIKKNQCLVIAVFSEKSHLNHLNFNPSTTKRISSLSSKLIEAGDSVWQSEFENNSLFLIHCGSLTSLTKTKLIKFTATIAQSLIKQGIVSATVYFESFQTIEITEAIALIIHQFEKELYQLLDFKTKKSKAHALAQIDFLIPDSEPSDIEEATAVAAGIRLTRDLAHLPANICTPSYLAKEASLLCSSDRNFHLKVHELNDISQMGMKAFLAVAQGSHEPPKLIELHYQGASINDAPIVLIGKGVTFDSGGISLKPADGMQEMKFDMAGAASVLGILKACALQKLKINLIGLMPCTENMPGGNATKPGDIITSLSQQTIEIINTDAEGRLILADALTYAHRFQPKWIIDIATLTGAAKMALGSVYSAFMTKNESLAALIHQAAEQSHDKAWRMPLDDDYEDAIQSSLADWVNSTFDRSAGCITAATFLYQFCKEYPWVHFDIAGTAWISGAKSFATGRPVALITELIRHAANSR